MLLLPSAASFEALVCLPKDLDKEPTKPGGRTPVLAWRIHHTLEAEPMADQWLDRA